MLVIIKSSIYLFILMKHSLWIALNKLANKNAIINILMEQMCIESLPLTYHWCSYVYTYFCMSESACSLQIVQVLSPTITVCALIFAGFIFCGFAVFAAFTFLNLRVLGTVVLKFAGEIFADVFRHVVLVPVGVPMLAQAVFPRVYHPLYFFGWPIQRNTPSHCALLQL